MKIFQIWIVLNSCIFMIIYFMNFLLLKYSRARSYLICLSAAALSVLLEIFRVYFAFDAVWPKVVVTAANILILQITALLLSKKTDSYTLFIGFSSSVFVLAGNVAACAVLLLSKNSAAAMAICTLVNAAVFLCMYSMIRDICTKVLSREISIWMCVIPAMYYITFFLMLYFPVSFEQRPENLYAAGSLLVTVVVMYILLIQYIDAKSGEKDLLWRNKELYAYIRGIELQTDAAESAVRDFKIMRHDMRHKDHLLIELLQDKKYTEAEQVLHKDIEYLDRTYLTFYCENAILNSLLCGMAKQAEKLDIRLQISCAVPRQQKIDDYDLAIATANLLENAIQAVSKLEKEERTITLSLKNRNGEHFFLEILNPCHEQVKFSKKTGLPLSSQGGEHGLGMLSVRDFVEKYHAQSDCFVAGQTFTVRILITFPPG